MTRGTRARLALRSLAIASALFGTGSRLALTALGGVRPPGLHRVHGAIVLSIAITALVYNLLLAPGIDHAGFSGLILVVNHTITPRRYYRVRPN